MRMRLPSLKLSSHTFAHYWLLWFCDHWESKKLRVSPWETLSSWSIAKELTEPMVIHATCWRQPTIVVALRYDEAVITEAQANVSKWRSVDSAPANR